MTGGGVHFDPTVNLGHIASVVMTLAAVVAGWATLDARVTGLERETRTEKADNKEAVVTVETRMMARVNEERARLDSVQAGLAYDIRDIKQTLRDGFKDLDLKLDRKVDKPGR